MFLSSWMYNISFCRYVSVKIERHLFVWKIGVKIWNHFGPTMPNIMLFLFPSSLARFSFCILHPMWSYYREEFAFWAGNYKLEIWALLRPRAVQNQNCRSDFLELYSIIYTKTKNIWGRKSTASKQNNCIKRVMLLDHFISIMSIWVTYGAINAPCLFRGRVFTQPLWS